MGLFDKIKKLNIFSGFFSVDEDFFEELEENLILSDMGMDTTLEAVETLRERVHDLKQLVKAYQLGWIKETCSEDCVW
mgnify:FL=1